MLDRTTLITGAGSGFGRLVAERLAAAGAAVTCADIDGATASATADAIKAAGGRAIAVACDVTRMADWQAAVTATVDAFGQLDVLVNNAGTMPLAFFADHAAALPAWERCLDVNLKGVLNGICAVHDGMLARGRGHVVNISSIYSNFPVAGAGVYGATKAAVNVLSESLRVESQGRIRVTNVRPTGVPATGLAGGVVNPEAVVGILGQHAEAYGGVMAAWAEGTLSAEQQDPDHPAYAVLAPEHIADQVVHAISLPWGVAIGDITVRATGDGYIL